MFVTTRQVQPAIIPFTAVFVTMRDFACRTLLRLPAMYYCRRSCRMCPATCSCARKYSFAVEGLKIFALRFLITLAAICWSQYAHLVLLSCTSCALNERVYSTFLTDTVKVSITLLESYKITSVQTACSYLRKSHAKRNLHQLSVIY